MHFADEEEKHQARENSDPQNRQELKWIQESKRNPEAFEPLFIQFHPSDCSLPDVYALGPQKLKQRELQQTSSRDVSVP